MNNSTFRVNIYHIHCSAFELNIIFNDLRVITFKDHISTFGQKNLTSGDGLAGLYIIFLLLLDLRLHVLLNIAKRAE